MKKQDLTTYCELELSLLVMNTESLYKVFMTSVRMGNFRLILDHVSDMFTFTKEQEDDLRDTWDAELEEQNKEESRSTTQIKASQPKRIEDNKQLTEKILHGLELWAIQFKLMGFPSETPRYSQLMAKNGYNGFVDNFDLISTQSDKLIHHLNLTDAENKFLSNMDFTARWEQYRDMRNKYLSENHPTIV